MIMEGILKNWRGFVNEGMTPEGIPDLKYYAFDWDDNILEMPTKIIFDKVETDSSTNEQKVIGQEEMSTEEFAVKRSELEQLGLKYRPDSFINFREEGDGKFLEDAMDPQTKKGPVWNMFVDCINSASIFAIITARGHNPNTLKNAVLQMINNEYSPSGGQKIDKNLFLENLNKFSQLMKKPIEGDPVMYYLNFCEFHPVSWEDKSLPARPDKTAASPEKAKVEALTGFINKAQSLAKGLRNRRSLRGSLRGKPLQIIFTDDDKKNIDTVKKELGVKKSLTAVHTGPQSHGQR